MSKNSKLKRDIVNTYFNHYITPYPKQPLYVSLYVNVFWEHSQYRHNECSNHYEYACYYIAHYICMLLILWIILCELLSKILLNRSIKFKIQHSIMLYLDSLLKKIIIILYVLPSFDHVQPIMLKSVHTCCLPEKVFRGMNF